MTTTTSSDPGAERSGATAPPAASPAFPVIGIGASAGGIQALLRLFEQMPADSGMAFVIVLHLSPKYESRVDQVLQRATSMPVLQVREPTHIEKNTIYLISPSNDLSMFDGYLKVTPAERATGRPIAIDKFFRSLADAHGARAISVILSGTGSDGTAGIGRVKECGGIALAQSPDDAEYGEMPQNAIATGLIDMSLPVVDLPQKLIELWNNAQVIQLPGVEGEPPIAAAPPDEHAVATAESALQAILKGLRVHTGHDFRHYKRATVLRRIERRLQVNALPDLPSYLLFLERHPDEHTALLRDMLIGVTNFFRDREAFEALEREVIPAILEGKDDEEQVRAWVAGCSTGEEAYSLAMLLCERLTEQNRQPGIQVFATDIDERAIEAARSGRYLESILTDVPPTRLRQFFTHARGFYFVSKALREKVLFAAHNILRDPPFSQLDLVTCRNLLIYLDRDVQRQVLQTFHFALRPGGYLFLGSSESAEIAQDLFAPVDKKSRIYRAKPASNRARITPPLAATAKTPNTSHTDAPRPLPRPASFSFAPLHQRVIEHFSPPSILIDRHAEILHMSEHVGRFLRYVGGEPSHNLLTVVNPDLRVELRTALYQALQHGRGVEVKRVRFSRGDAFSYVNLSVHPFNDEAAGGDVVAIFFDEFEETEASASPAPAHALGQDRIVTHLESELIRTKELLESNVEQSNLSTQELKASNEELQAINEELRSATEELETSKEELQSVNEELVTVNAELQMKVEDEAKANDDLQNLIASSGIATIFIDRAMRIKRFTAPAVNIFKLIETDIGRPLLDLRHRLNYPELAQDATAAFEALKVTEREVSTDEGDWFIARLLPYRTLDDRIDGAVLTLIDITARRRAEDSALASEERLKFAALTTNDYAIIVQDLDGVIVSWNRGAQSVFGYEEAEAIGKPIDLIFSTEDLEQGVPLHERQKASSSGRINDERWHVRKDGRQIYCSGVTTAIDTDGFRGYAKISRDLTDRKSAESRQANQLALERRVRTRAVSANRQKDEFFAVLSHELKNPLNLIHVKAEMLTRAPELRDVPLVRDAASVILRTVVGQAKIIDDLLDLSRARTGKLALQLSQVDISAILRTVVDASASSAAENGITLSASGVDQSVQLKADPVRLEQVFWNIIRNALKFTPSGGRVDVSLFFENGFVCVKVEDTGEGIEPDFLPRVFDMFSQSQTGVARQHSGLGIGLSLAKQLVEMHGGKIHSASDGVGQGATFSVTLPAVATLLPADYVHLHVDGSILKDLRVLLVDDSADALDAFRALLEMEGAKVRTEPGGKAALNAVAEAEFDLILSDIGMPGMSGYELIAELRKLPQTATVPAIALTGFGRDKDVMDTLQAGFDAHVGKPVSLAALLAAIGQVHLDRRAK
ncbi:CheR family methyltransferase [Paraburkholderia metrosideri]|uniref:histidine kinase n=1 Tax=Paraburkholderia metrosideri TaxID=580937 RepID=A0ABM8NKL5_9BURK|nr:CheR family methyltransferase [Paraburkholderia metrosideri]CAD6530383.1 Sensor histidine kinase RcsC [Paraburkholderia metrosideri]